MRQEARGRGSGGERRGLSERRGGHGWGGSGGMGRRQGERWRGVRGHEGGGRV